MNEAQAVCPQCKREVNFRKQGQIASCPLCGFQYQLSEPPYLGSSGQTENQVLQFFKVMAVALLVLAGVGAALAGILFVGCALIFRG